MGFSEVDASVIVTRLYDVHEWYNVETLPIVKIIFVKNRLRDPVLVRFLWLLNRVTVYCKLEDRVLLKDFCSIGNEHLRYLKICVERSIV